MKALRIKFKEAGIFKGPYKTQKGRYITSKGCGDRIVEVIEHKGKVIINKADRDNPYKYFEVTPGTLHVNHVSNLLHVLMGERPVPSFRSTASQKIIPEIFEAAKNSYVKVETPIVKSDKGEYYLTELVSMRKSVNNAWDTNISTTYHLNGEDVQVKTKYLTWEVLRVYAGQNLYDLIISTFKAIKDDISEHDDVSGSFTVKWVIEYLNKHNGLSKVKDLYVALRKGKKSDLYHLIAPKPLGKPTNCAHIFDKGDINTLTVNSSPQEINRISGEIYVPLNDDLLKRLRCGIGAASLLEGGLAYIAGIESWSDLLILDCTKVLS